MKNLNMLVWLTQLGLSVVLPLLGFIWIAVRLRDSYGWGTWVIWAGIILGILCAVDGLRTSLKAMERMSRDKQEPEPPVVFNDHD